MIETEEDFYSTIKLVTGEEVFAIVSTDPETPETLILQDPVVIQVIHGARAVSYTHLTLPTKRIV